jgi:hypothetical protein
MRALQRVVELGDLLAIAIRATRGESREDLVDDGALGQLGTPDGAETRGV